MKKKPCSPDEAPLVYSTEHGRMCPSCGQPASKCTCKKTEEQPRGDGTVKVGYEVAGRGGKSVTTISGVPLQGEELKHLATELKKRCGTGGTIKNGVIEIQGDHRDTIITELKKKGYSVKRAGG